MPATPSSPQPTLATLLRRSDLRLRLVAAETQDPEALERPLRWVHSSDLADPTPFLADDLTLLTTGTQFDEDDKDQIEQYVARLTDRGVVGLGFGTHVQKAGIPDHLADACITAGLPLFEVPYETPFIAIARAHSEAIAAQAYARRSWALETQRALAIAALRPRGLNSTLTELAKRLDHWVGMFDTTGTLVYEHPASAVPASQVAELAARASDLGHRGGQAGQSLTLGSESFTLFTLGRSGHLRGAIAIASSNLDPEARAVVTSVIAMAGLALEQNDQLDRARRRLRSQVLASLRLNDPTLARHVLGSLPHGPVIIAASPATSTQTDAMLDWWERQRTEHAASAFVAETADGLLACISAEDITTLDALSDRFSARVGVSEPVPYTAFSRGVDQALAALKRGVGGVTHFASLSSRNVLATLNRTESTLIADAYLAGLRAHDAAHNSDLEGTLRAWLEHDSRGEQAAQALGIHRHTLRTRITQASALLDVDLASFAARADLWAALQLSPR